MNNADSFQDLIRNSLVVHESATKFEKKVIDCILPSYDTKFYEYQNKKYVKRRPSYKYRLLVKFNNS